MNIFGHQTFLSSLCLPGVLPDNKTNPWPSAEQINLCSKATKLHDTTTPSGTKERNSHTQHITHGHHLGTFAVPYVTVRRAGWQGVISIFLQHQSAGKTGSMQKSEHIKLPMHRVIPTRQHIRKASHHNPIHPVTAILTQSQQQSPSHSNTHPVTAKKFLPYRTLRYDELDRKVFLLYLCRISSPENSFTSPHQMSKLNRFYPKQRITKLTALYRNTSPHGANQHTPQGIAPDKVTPPQPAHPVAITGFAQYRTLRYGNLLGVVSSFQALTHKPNCSDSTKQQTRHVLNTPHLTQKALHHNSTHPPIILNSHRTIRYGTV